MSRYTTLIVEQVADHVALVTMNRLASANALNTAMGLDLVDYFEGAAGPSSGGQQVPGAVSYRLKVSGDRGTGTASVRSPTGESSASQEMHALRIATNNGIKTGLNDGTDTSLTIHSQLAPSDTSVDAK